MICEERTILHCDANNFFASCECLNRKELANSPVAVAGNPKTRTGIILAKNEIAKQMGVKTGEAIWIAKQKCPNLVCLEPHMGLYEQISDRLRCIYQNYTDKIEALGIDECWLDITKTKHLFCGGDVIKIADEIRARVKSEIGITISCGVSFNKLLAKLGSDMKKPDATTLLSRENFKEKVYPLSVDKIIGIGRKNEIHLQKMNILTVGDIATTDNKILKSHFGINGIKLKRAILGYDDEDICERETKDIKSVSNSTTTIKDLTKHEEIKHLIFVLADKVCLRLRSYGLAGCKVHLYLKTKDFEKFGYDCNLGFCTNNAMQIATACNNLFDKFHTLSNNIRSIGVCVSGLKEENNQQISIFPLLNEKKHILEKTIDKIKAKYGSLSITRGSFVSISELLNTNKF